MCLTLRFLCNLLGTIASVSSLYYFSFWKLQKITSYSCFLRLYDDQIHTILMVVQSFKKIMWYRFKWIKYLSWVCFQLFVHFRPYLWRFPSWFIFLRWVESHQLVINCYFLRWICFFHVNIVHARYLRVLAHPVTVAARWFSGLIRDPYKPILAAAGWWSIPNNTCKIWVILWLLFEWYLCTCTSIIQRVLIEPKAMVYKHCKETNPLPFIIWHPLKDPSSVCIFLI